MFHETFNPYKPAIIEWPKLDPPALARLIAWPIWDIAVQTESKARLRMATYARSLADPDMAKQSGFFPPELVETFEPVMQEECRHILLFANWLAWRRAHLKLWRRPAFDLRVAAVWVSLVWKRIGIARGMNGGGKPKAQNANFTLNSGKAISGQEVSPAVLMELCLFENDRHFAGYDKRLRRPTTAPFLARVARFVLGRYGKLPAATSDSGEWRVNS